MYHDRTAWRAFFVGKKYGCSKGYPQRNAAHMGSISIVIKSIGPKTLDLKSIKNNPFIIIDLSVIVIKLQTIRVHI
jgi:hypothetical protein